MKITIEFKKRLIDYCQQHIQQRIDAFGKAMLDAQESANSEDKSSAGDKYETGRAMSQIARDMNAKQLVAAKNDLANLLLIDANLVYSKVQKGALIQTQNNQLILIATSIGMIDFEGQKIAVVSVSAPIASALINKTIGATIEVTKTTTIITQIV